jgi:stage V sporulation protein D (sporulation-specific penicillin-binding protein)
VATKSPRVWHEVPTRPRSRAVLGLIVVSLSVVFAVLVARLWWIQVYRHEEFREVARRLAAGRDTILAARGDIRTADDVIVARSVLHYEVGVDPLRLDSEGELVALVRVVCDTLEQPDELRRDAIRRSIQGRRQKKRFVRIARRVDVHEMQELSRVVRARFSPLIAAAVVRDPRSERTYPRGDFLGSVIGVTDLDGRGSEGLERWADRYLAHLPGSRAVRKDATQTMRFYFPENSGVSPVNGHDIELTIDSRVQRILEEELDAGARQHRVEGALGIVMDCRSGDVLAMASWPTYDPGEYHNYPKEERERRRKNRAIENTYEPGSIMKPFVAVWALAKGLTWRDEPLWQGGRTHVLEGRRRIIDTHDRGPLRMEEVVFHSSNIGMSFLGLRLGQSGLRECLDAFGLGVPTGIEANGEAPGARQKPDRWSEIYTSVSVSFGYEIRVTPIQMAAAFAALVNGGTLYKPRLVKRLVRGDREIEIPTVVRGRPISPELSKTMREILLQVVHQGTGKYLRMDGFEFGAKSGTSDIGKRYTKLDYLSSFEAFAPVDDPEIVVLVMMERPRGKRYYGAWVSGPVVAQVLRRYFRVEAQPRLVVEGLDDT